MSMLSRASEMVVVSGLMPWGALLSGLTSHAAYSMHQQKRYLLGEILFYGAVSGFVSLVLYATTSTVINIWVMVSWLLSFSVGLGLVWLFHRNFAPWLNHLFIKHTRISPVARKSRTDVRDIAQYLPAIPKAHNPFDFHNADPFQFFMGVGEDKQPIYWQGKLPHVLVAGSSGSGKGRKLQCLSAQSVQKGELVVFLDPKDDEFQAHVLYAACLRHQQPYHYLRLLPESPAQINILAGAKAWEIEEMLTASLDLGDKGKPSDHFMAKNRSAANYVAQICVERNLTLAQAHAEIAADAFWKEEAGGFIDKLRELAEVTAINAVNGSYNLPDMVASGGAVYVVGTMTLAGVLKAQQLIFVRIQQLATARDRLQGHLKTICVIADEFRYLISRPIIQGLGASRDKGMRVILAFQSFADLKDCPASLNPEAVTGAVIENTPCKLIYKLEDPDTADWLARKSGEIQVDDETIKLNRNIALSEIADAERTLRQGKDYLFDANLLSNLTAGWAVLYGQALAKLCYVSTCPVQKTYQAITPEAADMGDDAITATQSKSHATPHHFFDLEV